MTLAQRYEWSGTPFKAGLSPAAAHLQATASAADLSRTRWLEDWMLSSLVGFVFASSLLYFSLPTVATMLGCCLS